MQRWSAEILHFRSKRAARPAGRGPTSRGTASAGPFVAARGRGDEGGCGSPVRLQIRVWPPRGRDMRPPWGAHASGFRRRPKSGAHRSARPAAGRWAGSSASRDDERRTRVRAGPRWGCAAAGAWVVPGASGVVIRSPGYPSAPHPPEPRARLPRHFADYHPRVPPSAPYAARSLSGERPCARQCLARVGVRLPADASAGTGITWPGGGRGSGRRSRPSCRRRRRCR